MAKMPEPDLTDPDNPEWTEEMFARAKRVDELSPELQAAILAAFPRTKVRGRQKAPTKAQVTLRLDRDVLDHFRAAGEGVADADQRRPEGRPAGPTLRLCGLAQRAGVGTCLLFNFRFRRVRV